MKSLVFGKIDWTWKQMSRLEEIRNKRLSEVTSLDLAWLYNRVEELEEENKRIDRILARASKRNIKYIEQNQRYKQALEYTQSELEYAHVTGNMNLRNDLIKKSLKAIDKALAGDTE